MALSAQFVADFSSFNDAVAGATTKLITFEGDAGKVATALGRMENAYSGKAMIQNATEAVAAVERLGGASVLTADELAKVGNQAAQAAEKMRAMGIDVPEKLQQYADAAATADDKTKSLSVSVVDMVKAYVSAEAILEALKTAWSLLTDQVTESIHAAAEAEKTHVQMVAALQAQGTAIPSVIAAYDGYAEALQQTTVYQHDALEGSIALLVQVGGVMPKDMERALEATTNLASGLGIDLQSATMMVAKAAEGNTTALHRSGVTFDETRVAAEGFGYVLDTVNEKFGGQAAAVASTYEGRLKQLANTWQDVQESVGRVITQNETVLTAIGLVNDAIKTNTGELNENQTANDLVSAAVIAAAKAFGFLIDTASFLQGEFQDLRVFVDKVAQGFLDLGIIALKTGIAVAEARQYIDPSSWTPQFVASLDQAKTALAGLQGTYANLTADVKAAQDSQTKWSAAFAGVSTQIDDFVAKLDATRGKTKEVTTAADENSDAWNRNTINQKAAAEAAKAHAIEAKKLADAFAELATAGDGWKGTLDTIAGDVVESIVAYRDAGVEMSTLGTIYSDLSKTQLDAIEKLRTARAEELKQQTKDADDAYKLEQKTVEMTTKLWDEYEANRIKQTGTATDIKRAELDKQYNDAAAAANKLGIVDQQYWDALKARWQQGTDALVVDWSKVSSAMTNNTKAGLEEQATVARNTYNEMRSHYGEFSDDVINKSREAAEAAEKAAADFGRQWVIAADQAREAAAKFADEASKKFNEFNNAITLDTTDLDTLNQELSKFYDQLAAQGNVGMWGPGSSVGTPQAGTGAGAQARVPKFGTGGQGDFGSGTLVELHGKEAIVPLDGPNATGATTPIALAPPSGGPTIYMTINVTQPLGTPEAIARVVGDAQVQLLRGQGVRLPYGT